MASTRMMYMLLEQADRERLHAEGELQQAQAAALQAQRQMQRLLDYQYAYRQRWGLLFQEDSSEDMVQSYRSFMSRLQARISTQDRSARDHTRMAQAAREALRLQEQRVSALRNALARHEGAVTTADMGVAPLEDLDLNTGMQQFNGLVDTQRGVSSFHTTIVDIDLPLIPTWQPLDSPPQRGDSRSRAPRR